MEVMVLKIALRPVTVTLLLVLFALSNISVFQCASSESRTVYLFSYFKGNGEDGLHLAYSKDGLTWQALNDDQSILRPRVGEDKLMRDPCIIIGPDGKFHMVWTVSWNEKGIGYASSEDLVHWSKQQYIPVMEHEPNAENCWAPELFYDTATQQYLIFGATTIPGRFPDTDDQSNSGEPGEGRNHRMYYVTTKDFETFSDTRLFYDHGFNVIDATLYKDGDRYVMFLKDETNKPFTPQKNIRMATAAQAEGPYSPPSPAITGDYWAEGPTAIRIQGQWFVYFDKYRLDEFGLIVSSDLQTWEDRSHELSMPKGIRHGTVFSVERHVFERLQQHFE